jgi:hypothetical protein
MYLDYLVHRTWHRPAWRYCSARRRALSSTRWRGSSWEAVHSIHLHAHKVWGQRPGCRQSYRILYGVNSLRCRKCRDLKYALQYESPAFRLFNPAYKIRRRLGRPGSSGDPLPSKPKHMRWRTYRRLERPILRLELRDWPLCLHKSIAAVCGWPEAQGQCLRDDGVQMILGIPLNEIAWIALAILVGGVITARCGGPA